MTVRLIIELDYPNVTLNEERLLQTVLVSNSTAVKDPLYELIGKVMRDTRQTYLIPSYTDITVRAEVVQK